MKRKEKVKKQSIKTIIKIVPLKKGSYPLQQNILYRSRPISQTLLSGKILSDCWQKAKKIHQKNKIYQAAEKASTVYFRASPKELKTTRIGLKFGNKDLEGPRNFPAAKRALRVIRIGSGARQIWDRVEEANKAFDITPPLAVYGNEETAKLSNFCYERVNLSLGHHIPWRYHQN